ncbi:MAG: glutathionylspermidine synthase family protein [Parachlamydia sp.]|nr:glutathionylspermidine synthase family protein [Parachlamydia sp.]
MRRIVAEKRNNWQQRLLEQGLTVSTAEDHYWDESAFYEFSGPEMEKLSTAVEEVHGLYMKAIEVVIKEDLFALMGVQENAKELILASWKRGDFQLYGRFDFIYSGQGDAKLLEYNADTPITLLEAASVQKLWQQETHSHLWQFNFLEESLVERWRQFSVPTCHFACLSNSSECLMTTEYLYKTAEMAGIKSTLIAMEEIGYDGRHFVGLTGERIQGLFKLYPWEWLLEDSFGTYLVEDTIRLVEPAWKMLLNNKATLALLWKLFPDHPNLLPTYFTLDSSLGESWVRKPFFSREGCNIFIHHQGESIETEGAYGSEGYIYQQFIDLPPFEGHRPNLGLWMVGDLCCGLGLREDTARIIQNNSRFLPHLVV